MSSEKINKILTLVSISAGGIFIIKNLINKAYKDAILIGVGLFIFALLIFILGKLKVKKETHANQSTVNDISNAMNIYKENIANIIKDTTQINEVSNSMLELANE